MHYQHSSYLLVEIKRILLKSCIYISADWITLIVYSTMGKRLSDLEMQNIVYQRVEKEGGIRSCQSVKNEKSHFLVHEWLISWKVKQILHLHSDWSVSNLHSMKTQNLFCNSRNQPIALSHWLTRINYDRIMESK